MRFALISLLFATSALAGELCNDGKGACVAPSQCHEGTVLNDDQCGGGDLKCCTAQEGTEAPQARNLAKRHFGCHWILNGFCPGGDDVKWVIDYGGCWYISRGWCPGPSNYVRVVSRYY